ncbi:MAG: response regulator [Gammaproteobacteria bacterium]|jgi:two-component system phosphate regulon response regulator PhoB
MNKNLILLVEDEAPIRAMIRFALHHDFKIEEAESVKCAHQKIASKIPDLILLDWMLPDKSGIDFIKELKKNPLTRDIPIIMLTAKAEEENKVRGLTTGADDYITKPFSPRELIARVKTVLRRGPLATPKDLIHIKNLCINTKTSEAKIDDKLLKLTAQEYKLLHFFATHQNRVYSRNQLIDYIWGGASDIDERSVDASIKRLRKKLGTDWIQTVRGVGYRFL